MARDKNKGKATDVVVEEPANITRNKKGCAKRHARKAALLKMIDYVKKQEGHGLIEEIALLTPGQRFGEESGKSKLDSLAEFFTENTEMTGLEVYQKLGAGQGEMRIALRNLIKVRKPAERIWVHYDKPNDNYIVMGFGINAPKGWTGYRLVEVEDVEIL